MRFYKSLHTEATLEALPCCSTQMVSLQGIVQQTTNRRGQRLRVSWTDHYSRNIVFDYFCIDSNSGYHGRHTPRHRFDEYERQTLPSIGQNENICCSQQRRNIASNTKKSD